MDPRNSHIQRQDQLQAAKKKWQESEWLLNFLRSDSGLAPSAPTDHELLEWAQKSH